MYNIFSIDWQKTHQESVTWVISKVIPNMPRLFNCHSSSWDWPSSLWSVNLMGRSTLSLRLENLCALLTRLKTTKPAMPNHLKTSKKRQLDPRSSLSSLVLVNPMECKEVWRGRKIQAPPSILYVQEVLPHFTQYLKPPIQRKVLLTDL